MVLFGTPLETATASTAEKKQPLRDILVILHASQVVRNLAVVGAASANYVAPCTVNRHAALPGALYSACLPVTELAAGVAKSTRRRENTL